MDRPLPYLIGSQAFMEQDDVGLGDLSSDGNILSSLCMAHQTLHNVVFISLIIYFSSFDRDVS